MLLTHKEWAKLSNAQQSCEPATAPRMQDAKPIKNQSKIVWKSTKITIGAKIVPRFFLGAVFGASWSFLRASWEHLGAFWCVLGSSCGAFKVSGGVLGRAFGRFGIEKTNPISVSLFGLIFGKMLLQDGLYSVLQTLIIASAFFFSNKFIASWIWFSFTLGK